MSAEKGMKPRFLSVDGRSSASPIHHYRGGDDHDEDDVETPHHDVVVAVAVHKPPLPPVSTNKGDSGYNHLSSLQWHQSIPPPSYAN